MDSIRNLLTTLPPPDAEVFETLFQADAARVERIVSHGQVSPEGFWYDQEQNEWVLILTGAATLRFADEAAPLLLRAGDCIHIAAHRRHRVEWTDPDRPTVWLAVHYR